MSHIVTSVEPLSDFYLRVTFAEGETKLYDISPWFDIVPAFQALRDTPGLYETVTVESDGSGIHWNAALNLSSEELFEGGF